MDTLIVVRTIEGGPMIRWIAAGGVIGALCRYGLDVLVAGGRPLTPQDYPIATLTINIIGCLAIGILAPLILARPRWPYARPFLITGVLGGFTTFSAFAAQSGMFLVNGEFLRAGSYVALTLLGGLFAVWVGKGISTKIIGPIATKATMPPGQWLGEDGLP